MTCFTKEEKHEHTWTKEQLAPRCSQQFSEHLEEASKLHGQGWSLCAYLAQGKSQRHGLYDLYGAYPSLTSETGKCFKLPMNQAKIVVTSSVNKIIKILEQWEWNLEQPVALCRSLPTFIGPRRFGHYMGLLTYPMKHADTFHKQNGWDSKFAAWEEGA